MALQPPRVLNGGGGMLSTVADYLRFARMLEREGELDGVRVLGTRTVRLMTQNHLDGEPRRTEHRWVQRDHPRGGGLRTRLRHHR